MDQMRMDSDSSESVGPQQALKGLRFIVDVVSELSLLRKKFVILGIGSGFPVAAIWHGNKDPAARSQDPTQLSNRQCWPRCVLQDVLENDQAKLAIFKREMLQRADFGPKTEATAMVHDGRSDIYTSCGKAESPGCQQRVA
jgi:hypothetical protein